MCGHHFDGRVPPFGLVCSFSNSMAWRLMASSVLGLPIRCLAAASSAFAAVLRRLQTSIDPVLPGSVVDRLVADVEVVRDASDAPPVSKHIEDLARNSAG